MLLSSHDFFELKLKPVLSTSRYRSMTVDYRVSGADGVVLGDEFLILRGLRVNSKHPIGLETYATRRADNDDPHRIAEFLLKISTGQIHPAIYRYLLSTATQIELKTGQRPPIMPMPGTEKTKKTEASVRMAADFAENLAIDNDVKRVAAKRNFDQKFVEKVLGAERPHLLEDLNNGKG